MGKVRSLPELRDIHPRSTFLLQPFYGWHLHSLDPEKEATLCEQESSEDNGQKGPGRIPVMAISVRASGHCALFTESKHWWGRTDVEQLLERRQTKHFVGRPATPTLPSASRLLASEYGKQRAGWIASESTQPYNQAVESTILYVYVLGRIIFHLEIGSLLSGKDPLGRGSCL